MQRLTKQLFMHATMSKLIPAKKNYVSFKQFHPFKIYPKHKFSNIKVLNCNDQEAISKLFQVFALNNLNISYISKENIGNGNNQLEITCQQEDPSNFQKARIELNKIGVSIKEIPPIRVPWFPQNMLDMDRIGRSLQKVQQNMEHSQFKDQEYRERRNVIAKAAIEYRHGDRIPDIKYSHQETQFWCSIYAKLSALHQKVMSRKYLQQMEALNRELRIDRRIPQLSELSEYLKSRTGFRIKPTHGVLSQREFLNALAFKHFCSTQYLRNVKNPEHSPQPDIIHEVIGHIPMFADPDVAEISHKIGLLSLGASDEELVRLGTLYWWTLEFGVCREEGKLVGYGAGIASSISEIENMLNPQTKFKKLQVFEDCSATYTDQTVQSMYRVTECFSQFIEKLKQYGESIKKPFAASYNEKMEEIEYDRAIERVHTQDSEDC